ncbi:trypsin-like peptidase domain-containing protein [Streptomyces sp. NPDC058683]|uniref:VMAP-C domain-containing protein n=1 Tax=Streptomyces sp. NPDC058683 TaxID=3346597 RepID=UPI003646AE77
MAGEPTGESGDHESWLVRVQGDDGRPAGYGFLFTRDLVLTCAHVVTDALGVSRFSENGPRGPLSVVRHGTQEPVPAQVMPGGWVPLRDSSGDFAMLSLDDTQLLPSPRADRARIAGRVRLITPDAELPAVVAALPGPNEPDGWGLLTFEGATPRPGSGGSPVVDGKGAVVGLLTDVEATTRTARHVGRFLPLSAVLERILVPSPHASGTERPPDAGLTLRERGELVEALLAVPVMHDRSAFALLARELRHEVPGVGLVSGTTTRLRALDLLGQFSRRPEDLRRLVEVLRVFDPGSSEVEAFGTLVDKVAAPSLLLAHERRTLQGLLARPELDGGVALLERVRDLENRGAPPGRSPALLEFVSQLADSVPGAAGAGLDTWQRSVAARLGTARPPERTTEPPVLVIRVDPLMWDPRTYGVTTSVRAADGTTMLGTDDRVPHQELMTAIVGALRTVERHERATPGDSAGQVEFVLPYQLLYLPVDELDTGDGVVPRPLGTHRTVVVRAAELEERVDLHGRWHARWRQLKETPPARREPHWVDGVDGRALLLDASGLTFRPSGDAVAACLLQGVPVLIWSRDASPAAQEALTALARRVPLEEIPEAVRSWRDRQHRTGTGEKVRLLFADPERPLPKDEPLVSPDSG